MLCHLVFECRHFLTEKKDDSDRGTDDGTFENIFLLFLPQYFTIYSAFIAFISKNHLRRFIAIVLFSAALH